MVFAGEVKAVPGHFRVANGSFRGEALELGAHLGRQKQSCPHMGTRLASGSWTSTYALLALAAAGLGAHVLRRRRK